MVQMNGFILGLLSLCLLAVAIVLWVRLINGVALERRRGFLYALCIAGIASGAAAFTRDPGWIGGAMATIAIAGGLVWITLGLLAGQSKGESNLVLGAPIPAFNAPDHENARFEIESLRGHPVLIKLFRGHW
jgi:hypothetical protein